MLCLSNLYSMFSESYKIYKRKQTFNELFYQKKQKTLCFLLLVLFNLVFCYYHSWEYIFYLSILILYFITAIFKPWYRVWQQATRLHLKSTIGCHEKLARYFIYDTWDLYSGIESLVCISYLESPTATITLFWTKFHFKS